MSILHDQNGRLVISHDHLSKCNEHISINEHISFNEHISLNVVQEVEYTHLLFHNYRVDNGTHI